jgi:hypothetical protein
MPIERGSLRQEPTGRHGEVRVTIDLSPAPPPTWVEAFLVRRQVGTLAHRVAIESGAVVFSTICERVVPTIAAVDRLIAAANAAEDRALRSEQDRR